MDETSRKSSISVLSGTSSFLEGLQLRPFNSDEESVTTSESHSYLSDSELSGTSSILGRMRFLSSYILPRTPRSNIKSVAVIILEHEKPIPSQSGRTKLVHQRRKCGEI